jgi:hypothetical protein
MSNHLPPRHEEVVLTAGKEVQPSAEVFRLMAEFL